jgi:hypothetical protein
MLCQLVVCQFLVEKGADVDAAENDRYDTQHYAFSRENALVGLAVLITFSFWFSQWRHPAALVFFFGPLGRLPVPGRKGSRREYSRQRALYPRI